MHFYNAIIRLLNSTKILFLHQRPLVKMCVHSHHHLTSIVRVERSRYRRHERVAKTLESSHSRKHTTRVDCPQRCESNTRIPCKMWVNQNYNRGISTKHTYPPSHNHYIHRRQKVWNNLLQANYHWHIWRALVFLTIILYT